MPKKYQLPYLYLEEKGDFIILTPLDILTKDDSAINNSEFYSNNTPKLCFGGLVSILKILSLFL